MVLKDTLLGFLCLYVIVTVLYKGFVFILYHTKFQGLGQNRPTRMQKDLIKTELIHIGIPSFVIAVAYLKS